MNTSAVGEVWTHPNTGEKLTIAKYTVRQIQEALNTRSLYWRGPGQRMVFVKGGRRGFSVVLYEDHGHFSVFYNYGTVAQRNEEARISNNLPVGTTEVGIPNYHSLEDLIAGIQRFTTTVNA